MTGQILRGENCIGGIEGKPHLILIVFITHTKTFVQFSIENYKRGKGGKVIKARRIWYGVFIVIFIVSGAIGPKKTYGGLQKESTKYSTLYWSNEKYSDLIKKKIAPSVDRYVEDLISKFVSGDWSQGINSEIWFSDVNVGIPEGEVSTYKKRGTYNIITLNPTRDYYSLISDLIHELAHLVQVKYNPNLTITEYENFAEEMVKWLRR